MVCAGTSYPATLFLSASNSSTVQVNYQPNVLMKGPGADMPVNIQFPGGPGALINLTSGTATITFGAVLTVNPNQTPGDYNATFSVTVDYP
jgi:type 1 fimbria pilin